MAQAWLLIVGEGEFATVSHGLSDDKNPAPEGAQIFEAETEAQAIALAELESDLFFSGVEIEQPLSLIHI